MLLSSILSGYLDKIPVTIFYSQEERGIGEEQDSSLGVQQIYQQVPRLPFQ